MPKGENAAKLEGQRFGRLLVESRAGSNPHKKALWNCVCECGNRAQAVTGDLNSGQVISCGCYRDEVTLQRSYKHGGSPRVGGERLYGIWTDMRKRTSNPNSWAYQYYGGKGVVICDAWSDYSAFRSWALQNGYRDNLTIDRRDSSKNYSPENCEWVTQSENSRRRWHGAPPRIKITLTLEGTLEELAPIISFLNENRRPGKSEAAA